MCILRCFSERASKLHTSKGSSRRDKNVKIVSKKVPILPKSPKFLMRLINVLFACASSDVSRKELQSCTKKRKFKLRSKWPPKRVYILPPSPKFLTRLIHVLFACASSDVSQKELQSSTQQKEVQSEIKSAKVVPKKYLFCLIFPNFWWGQFRCLFRDKSCPKFGWFFWGKTWKGLFPTAHFQITP